MHLYICCESYSTNQGWIEGALETSNAVVKLIKSTIPSKIKLFSKKQVEKSSSLIIINNNVYDIHINDWINNHPGGTYVIKRYVGNDATTIFKNIHPEYAYLNPCMFLF